MENLSNPFLVSGYKGANYFCNRKKETVTLKTHIKNGRNTSLFAIRRLGKTGLIHHVFDSYKNNPKTACIYLDVFGTKNLKEFTNQMATAIYNRFPENKGIGKKLIGIIKSLRPLISYDALSGNPELSFELGEARQYEKTIQQLLTFVDQQNIKAIFAIDEFQQILEYPEKNTEAVLRTHIQSLKNINFIFCGSNQKLMHEIFNTAKRPFYASCSNMHIGFITTSEYAPFITGLFNQHKRKISPDAVALILDWTMCHTFYTQHFCNFIFASNLKRIEENDVQSMSMEILRQNEGTFYQIRNLITDAQWNLLSAIAKETTLYKAHSKDFINKYGLGTSSMVTRGLESLLEKELIYYNAGVAKPYYEVYDKYMMRWLQNK